MGGIGFTMSLFIAELGFVEDVQGLLMTKSGVFMALLMAGILSFLCLYFISKKSGE